MKRRWLEPLILILLLATASLLWLFLWIAEEVVEGETHAIDSAILIALHPANDPDGTLGPAWVQSLARDITSLGSPGVLCLLVAITTIYLLLARRVRAAIFVFVATSLGYIANVLLKHYFNRPRPSFAPHDILVSTTSFPSGHAMLSATVYLTLGTLLASIAPTLQLRLYVLCVATLLSLLVGLSRIYLGVHWPSDVLAGWAVGAGWALGAWAIANARGLGSKVTA